MQDPAATSASPDTTVGQLETQIRGQLSGRVRGVQLLVRDNGLVLKGRARDFYAKQLAQHLVMRGTTLPILANEIEVT